MVAGLAALASVTFQRLPASPPQALVMAADEVDAGEADGGSDFVTKVVGAAAQGAVAACVAALLSAFTEPVVNRLLVERCTVQAAINAIKLQDCLSFFMTTFPTNMIKFPVFEVINTAMGFTGLSGSTSGIVSGWLFCTVMLPVTNFRFRKSMNLPIEPKLLYQAYLPTVLRDIAYGWARGVAAYLVHAVFPNLASSFVGNAVSFGIVVWLSCILSAPFNEWRGYSLQPPAKKLPFSQFFKPERFVRSTGVGATIMGVSLCVGNLLVPFAETLFALAKANKIATGVVLVCIVAAKTMLGKKK